jgi:GH25 family lysozyme M1 (1,4-beta-N-acetylmuramidase)
LREFLRPVECGWGRTAILYVRRDFADRYPVPDDPERLRWEWGFLLRPHEDWIVWQLHGYAHVEGITGGVDLDVMRPARPQSPTPESFTDRCPGKSQT